MNPSPRVSGLWRVSPALLLLLLLPLLGVLPPVPIDETRYLSIAWEMRQTGSWVTLHLNGLPYFDKPPLLFWLMNAGWSAFGVSLWAARAMVLLCGAGCVELCRRVEQRLAPEANGEAAWVLCGFIFFALFSGVVMFDVTLCLCVVLGFLGAVTYVQTGSRGALAILFVASALGVLTKGPVLLLHLAVPLAAARWWSAVGKQASWRDVAVLVLTALLGGLPALLWAWAAVHHLSDADAHNLLLRQTAGRVVQSFAHNRPVWWYLPWVPVLLLPWPVLLRWRRVAASGQRLASSAARFGLCASVPALFAFCLVSGKQLHYLLPLLPGVALLLGAWLRQDQALLSPRRMWVMVALIAAVLLWSLWGKSPVSLVGVSKDTAMWLYLSSAALLVLAVVYLLVSGSMKVERRAAIGMLLLTMALLPLIRLQAVGSLDMRGIAARVAELHAQGVPLARTNDEPGLITFLARLPEPLPAADDPVEWARQHPNGVLLLYSGRGSPHAGAEQSVKLANGWMGLMSSQAVLADPDPTDRRR